MTSVLGVLVAALCLLTAGTTLDATTVRATRDVVAQAAVATLRTVTAGNDARATATASLSVGSLTAGQDASLSAGTTLTAATVQAARDVVAQAADATLGTATAGNDARATTTASLSVGTLTAGQDAGLAAGTTLDATTVQATRDVVVQAADAALGMVTAGNDARATTAASLGVATLTTGQDAALRAGSTLDASTVRAGRAASLQSGSDLRVGSLTAGADAQLAADGALAAGGLASTGGALRAQAGGNLQVRATAQAAGSVQLAAGGALDANEVLAGTQATLAAAADLRVARLRGATAGVVAGGRLQADDLATTGDAALQGDDVVVGTADSGGSLAVRAARDIGFGTLRVADPQGLLALTAGRDVQGTEAESAGSLRVLAGGSDRIARVTARSLLLDSQSTLSLDVLQAQEADLRSATEVAVQEARIGQRIAFGTPSAVGRVVHTGTAGPLQLQADGHAAAPAKAVQLAVASAQGVVVSPWRAVDGLLVLDTPSWQMPGAVVPGSLTIVSNGLRTVVNNRQPSPPSLGAPATGTTRPLGVSPLLAGQPALGTTGIDVSLYEPDTVFDLSQVGGALTTSAYVVGTRPGVPVTVTNYTATHAPAPRMAYGTPVLTVQGLEAELLRAQALRAGASVRQLPPVARPPAMVPPPAGQPAVRASEEEAAAEPSGPSPSGE